MSTPGRRFLSVGRTEELSALLFGTTELAHVVADVLGDVADGVLIDLAADGREAAGTASPGHSAQQLR